MTFFATKRAVRAKLLTEKGWRSSMRLYVTNKR